MESRRTKIVATIGPASDSVSAISDLLYAGVDVFRINLSHGEIEGNLDRLRRVREASKATGHEVAVLADLPGPKIRVCPFPEGGVEMMPGAEVTLSEAERPSSGDEICVNVAGLFTGLAEDDQVVLGDGTIMLRVTSAG
ncbi:MAG: pyruvate kinase, partial [Actinomycetota bacterium]|nr:pyruvate kinase [Actinomycetota bacterium]